MRLRALLLAAALVFTPILAASAETVRLRDTLYVYPGQAAASHTLTLSVLLQSLDPETLAFVADGGASRAVFAVYAKGPGGFVPFPDPKDPSKPCTLVVDGPTASFALPLSIDLYLRQEIAQAGYEPDPGETDEGYIPLRLPGEVVVVNRKAGARGFSLRLTGETATGTEPLAGQALTLTGGGGTYALTTDADGAARLFGLPAGSYTLTQDSAPAGYRTEAPVAVNVPKSGVAEASLTNLRNGTISVRTLGISVGADLNERLLPVPMRYRVLTADGTAVGELGPEAPLEVAAARDGAVYTLIPIGEIAGYAPPEGALTATVYPGGRAECVSVLRGQKGFFLFSLTDAATGAPVAGGLFALTDASGGQALTFSPGGDGLFAVAEPLPAGSYTVTMLRAPDGYRYAGEVLPLTVAPYAGEPPKAAALAVRPLPDALRAPTVTAAVTALPSLLDADARADIALSLAGETDGIAVRDLAFAIDPPAEPGVSLSGDTLTFARRFALDGAPVFTDFAVSGVVSFVYDYPVAPDESREVAVRQPFTVTVATFAQKPAPRYAASGHVKNAEGVPMTGVAVRLVGGDGAAVAECVTDPFGGYAFETAPAGASAMVVPPQGFAARMEGCDATVLPVRTVAVRVEGYGVSPETRVTLSMPGLDPVEAKAGETARLTGLIAPSDTLSAAAPDGVLSHVAREGDGWVARLYAPASVSGTVGTPDGAPLPGVSVTLTGPETMTATTGADGGYRFDGLPPDGFDIVFTAPDGYVSAGEAALSVTLGAGETRGGQDALMMRPATVEGILTEGGTPVSGVAVRLSPSGAKTATDAAGRFAFGGLTLGEYTLSVEAPEGMAIGGLPEKIHITKSGEARRLVLSASRPARIAGRIWNDANDDGLLGTGEGGLAEARVALLDESEGVVSDAVTTENGQFAFRNLPPGTYRVQITLPDGYLFTRPAPDTNRLVAGVDSREGVSEPIALSSGQAADGLLAGGTLSGGVSGTVYDDPEGRGLPAVGLAALSGARVTLLRGDETQQTVVTGADGQYAFDDLRAGDYTVAVAATEGYVFTSPYMDAGTASRAVEVRAWRRQQTADFAAQRTCAVTARVWLDDSASGSPVGKQPCEGLTVALFRMRGETELPVATAETDAAGFARFDGLRPGAYRTRVTLPGEDYGFTVAPPSLVDVAAGQTADLSVGVTRLGGISGVVFADADWDGLKSALEGGISSARVTLKNAKGETIGQTQTGADGTYAFTGLLTGRYTVQFTLPTGYQFTKNRQDAPSFNSDVPETEAHTAEIAALFLPMGASLPVDAGGFGASSIAGKAWQDARNIGRLASDSPPVAGMGIHLSRGGAPFRETVTGADGTYAFEGLPPGDYAVSATLPDGALPVGGDAQRFTLAMGAQKTGVNLGMIHTGALTGQVRDDATGAAVEGATVLLLRGGDVQAEAVTGADGAYRFDRAYPGAAEARVELPDDRIFGKGETGIRKITVPQRDTVAAEAFRLLQQAVVEGRVWIDADRDGVYGDGDAPMEDAVVKLVRVVDGKEEAQSLLVSGADGSFRFAKLAPGEVMISVSPPADKRLYGSGEAVSLTLRAGDTHTRAYPGYTAATVYGAVYDDADNSANRERGEPGIGGVLVRAVDAEGRVLAEYVTEADGAYALGGLPPAPILVVADAPSGYQPSENAPEAALTPDMGETVNGVDLGLLRMVRIGDLCWLDKNENGLQDSGEPGIPNVVVTLWRVLPDGSLSNMGEAVTDAYGRYRFDGLYPGVYQASFDPGKGFRPTVSVPGLPEINSKAPETGGKPLMSPPITVRSGEHALMFDAGFVIEK